MKGKTVIYRSNIVTRAMMALIMISTMLVISPSDLFSKGTCCPPVARVNFIGRIIKSVKKGPTKTGLIASKYVLQGLQKDSEFNDNKMIPNVRMYNHYNLAGPYFITYQYTNYLDSLDLGSYYLKGIEFAPEVGVLPVDNSVGFVSDSLRQQNDSITVFKTSPIPPTVPQSNYELQRNLSDLRKSIENTKNSYNGASKR